METADVLEIARRAKAAGVTRVCMGAAWREVRRTTPSSTACSTWSARSTTWASRSAARSACSPRTRPRRLEDAGLLRLQPQPRHVSETFYGKVITTRTFADRLQHARQRPQDRTSPSAPAASSAWARRSTTASPCSTRSRASTRSPESVPINVLSKVDGTPLETAEDVPWDDVVRMIATARILMPSAVVRLSAGRAHHERERAGDVLHGRRELDLQQRDRKMLTKAVPSPDYDAGQGAARQARPDDPPAVQGRPARTKGVVGRLLFFQEARRRGARAGRFVDGNRTRFLLLPVPRLIVRRRESIERRRVSHHRHRPRHAAGHRRRRDVECAARGAIHHRCRPRPGRTLLIPFARRAARPARRA